MQSNWIKLSQGLTEPYVEMHLTVPFFHQAVCRSVAFTTVRTADNVRIVIVLIIIVEALSL